MSTDIKKKTGTLAQAVQKIDFLMVDLEGLLEVVPPNYVKIFVCYISTGIKYNWHPSLSHSQN